MKNILLLAISILFLTSCAGLFGPKVEEYSANKVAFSGSMNSPADKCGPACAILLKEFGWVKACMKVEEPVAYPNIVIYECPKEAKQTADDDVQKKCKVPCGESYAWTCYEGGVIKLPNETTYFPKMRQDFVQYISDQTKVTNAVYFEECKGGEDTTE